MSEARLEAAEDRGVDVFGFVARFAPTLFLIVLMVLLAIIEPRFLSSINRSFHSRRHSLICFSRLIAASIVSCSSNQTSVLMA